MFKWDSTRLDKWQLTVVTIAWGGGVGQPWIEWSSQQEMEVLAKKCSPQILPLSAATEKQPGFPHATRLVSFDVKTNSEKSFLL